MNAVTIQLEQLGFPPEIKRHFSHFSIENLNSFVSRYLENMIASHGLRNVQSAIDSDSNPHNPIINYITCIMELGMLHELYHQSFASANPTILNQRMEFLAWAINISVANHLKEKGIERIPSLGSGQINIYYSWNNMEIIIQRIMPIASQIEGAVPSEVRTYIDNLIYDKLE